MTKKLTFHGGFFKKKIQGLNPRHLGKRKIKKKSWSVRGFEPGTLGSKGQNYTPEPQGFDC